MDESLIQISDEAFVGTVFRRLLGREALERERLHYVGILRAGRSRLLVIEELLKCQEFRESRRGSRFAPPGHFYSPIPSEADILRHFDGFDRAPPGLSGIDLREDRQLLLLDRFRGFYAEIPFSDQKQSGLRYYYDNPNYSYADAIFLHCTIRDLEPRKIVEIGSGNSSCVILDTNDRFFDGKIECVFIEPNADFVKSLLLPEDTRSVRLIEKKLQELDVAYFEQLEAGDILFVDSTHVSKLGSDVNALFFEILPSLRQGVVIHVHDVFYPFEYPIEWLEEGRAWNEQYLLRAFLQYNQAFDIRLFSSFVISRHTDWFERHMPDCLKNTGGCLWLEKVV